MAGHSKWANIKHRKSAKDAQKSKRFGRLIRELTMAAKQGGTNVDSNPRLRIALQNAKSANMPKDNIIRAMAKGESKDAVHYKEVTYEGYGPKGIAVIVECMTDNIKRTVAAIRSIFTKYGGSMSKKGALTFLFDRKGVFNVSIEEDTDIAPAWTLPIIDLGAENIEKVENHWMITCPLVNFGAIQQYIEKHAIIIQDTSLPYIANTLVSIDKATASKIEHMIEALEAQEDVQHIFHNMQLVDTH